ncbi:MAG: D-2-hydroxyacid dehydrogenase family protein [Rhodospirillales bacterium]|nr:D-2-hydroxyacid dehydrogenase family protein [Rhodospirillales bacterium]
MTRIAILDDYQDAALTSADWSTLDGCEAVVFNQHLGWQEDHIASALAGFEVIVCMRERTPFPKSQLDKLPDLKLLVTTGLRNLSIDMDAARANGVVVSGTQMLGYPAYEHAWALILAITKQIPFEDQTMKNGGWQQGVGVGLSGKTLGILGLGKLGSAAARIGKAFDMEVIAWSQNLTAEAAAAQGVSRVDKDELLQRSDVISIHMILSERTRGLIGAKELAMMKPSAYLVNTSRGPIVDEAALISALQQHTIAGAGIDVYDLEPLPADHAIRKLDNVVLTGHTGFVVRELHQLAYGQAVENIGSWLAGTPQRVLNEG